MLLFHHCSSSTNAFENSQASFLPYTHCVHWRENNVQTEKNSTGHTAIIWGFGGGFFECRWDWRDILPSIWRKPEIHPTCKDGECFSHNRHSRSKILVSSASTQQQLYRSKLRMYNLIAAQGGSKVLLSLTAHEKTAISVAAARFTAPWGMLCLQNGLVLYWQYAHIWNCLRLDAVWCSVLS